MKGFRFYYYAIHCALLICLAALIPIPVASQQPITTPTPESITINQLRNLYSGKIAQVIDGDTVDVEMALWDTFKGIKRIRLARAAAPETLRTNAKCAKEVTQGKAVKAYVEQLLPVGLPVQVYNTTSDQFGNRIVGELYVPSLQINVTNHLLAINLIDTYKPGKVYRWCDTSTTDNPTGK